MRKKANQAQTQTQEKSVRKQGANNWEKLKNRKNEITSTQEEIPVHSFHNGCIVTTDNRLVKIIELQPTQFDNLDIPHQNALLSSFQSAINIFPAHFQFTTMAIPFDLSYQITKTEADISIETNKSCQRLGKAYIDMLNAVQNQGVKHRFFLTIQSDRNYNYISDDPKENKLGAATKELNSIAERIANTMDSIGNDSPVTSADIAHYGLNYFPKEILYKTLNRSSELDFNQRFNIVYNQYADALNTTGFVVKPSQYLAPFQMAFTSSKYAKVDNTYYSFLYFVPNNYPQNMLGGWLTRYINFAEGVDVNIFFEKQNREQMTTQLTRNIAQTIGTVADNDANTVAYENSASLLKSASHLKQGLLQGLDFFYMAIMITVSGKTAQEVDEKVETLISMAKQKNQMLKVCSYQIKEAFMSSLPLAKMEPTLFERAKNNVLTPTVASTYPYAANEFYDPDGVWLGANMSGSMAVLDLFAKRFTNSNLICCGASGSGKSFTMKVLAMRMRIQHTTVYIIEPEKQDEIKDLCNYVGGQFIDVSSGSKTCINVMEIRKRDMQAISDDNKDIMQGSQMLEKVSTIVECLKAYKPTFTETDEDLLGVAVKDTYLKFGITEDNSSLYDPTDPAHERFKTMPTLKDLYDIIDERAQRDNRYSNLQTGLYALTNGPLASVFAGQTNVNLNNQFIVFGIQKLSGARERPLGLEIIMDFIYSEAQAHITKKKALFVDEVWSLAQTKNTAEYLIKFAKTARSLRCATLLFTQQFSDLFGKNSSGESYGASIVGNCNSKLLLKLEAEDADLVQEPLHLSDYDKAYLIGLNPSNETDRGAGLYISNGQTTPIKIIGSQVETALAGTRVEEIEMRKRIFNDIKREEEEERQKAMQMNRPTPQQTQVTPANNQQANAMPNIVLSLDDIDYSIDGDDENDDEEFDILFPTIDTEPDEDDDLDMEIFIPNLEPIESKKEVQQEQLIEQAKQQNEAARQAIQQKRKQQQQNNTANKQQQKTKNPPRKGAHKSRV